MLPCLAAEDVLDASTAAGLGSGMMKNAGRIIANLQQVSRGGGKARRGHASPAALAAMGIAVVSANG